MNEAALKKLVEFDSIYQAHLQQLKSIEPEYLSILNSLPASQRQIIDRYIFLCEELDHRKLSLLLCHETPG